MDCFRRDGVLIRDIWTLSQNHTKCAADEKAMVYYFMMSHLRNGKALGLGENKWSNPDDKKLKAAKSLTEEQKTIVRRDFLHHHLTDGTHTVSSVRGGLMLAFANLHLPEQTAKITTAYKDEYAKKNARLDERIAELKKQMAPAKTAATPKALPAKTAEVPKATLPPVMPVPPTQPANMAATQTA